MNTTQVLATLYRQSFRKRCAHCHCSAFWMRFGCLLTVSGWQRCVRQHVGLFTSELIESG